MDRGSEQSQPDEDCRIEIRRWRGEGEDAAAEDCEEQAQK
jgi:hypothetical protein